MSYASHSQSRPCSSPAGRPITPYTPVKELSEYLTVKEVCTYTRRSRNSIYGAIRCGQIPHLKVGEPA